MENMTVEVYFNTVFFFKKAGIKGSTSYCTVANAISQIFSKFLMFCNIY